MKELLQVFFILTLMFTFTACSSGGDGEEGSSYPEDIGVKCTPSLEVECIPTLVIVMNWNDYAENDPSIWYDKIFNQSESSVNKWYQEVVDGKVQLIPVNDTSGIPDDGIIFVEMGKDHPGGYDDTAFRDIEITHAVTSTEVVDSVDFAALDIDNDGRLNIKEMQIIFIVSGGEESYGDPIDHSIWAHAWAFIGIGPIVDGVNVMLYIDDNESYGAYSRFGANHDTHKATIGIIAHELGHSLLSLGDYYDVIGGSGLGWYDIMSNGSWAWQSNDSYHGETPTQFSTYNKMDTNLSMNIMDVNSSQNVTIKCSSGDAVKLVTTKVNEYFLIECRDTAKENSDIALNIADNRFTENRLFTMLYHVDTDKTDNSEDGIQTDVNHYKVSLVEKEPSTLMTSTEDIRADYDDVYMIGDSIDTTKTKLYDGTNTGYRIDIIGHDYANRTMTLSVTK